MGRGTKSAARSTGGKAGQNKSARQRKHGQAKRHGRRGRR